MLTGIFTPTEVAAIAVAYLLLINTFIYREFDWKNPLRALKESVVTISGIMMIFPAASLYTMILTLNDAPQTFAAMMLGISSNINVLCLLLNIMLLVVGMFMGNTEAILLIVPIVAPLMTGLGVDASILPS
jgi:TRAP-type C4-dicarboxylate transport system permease large subunit